MSKSDMIGKLSQTVYPRPQKPAEPCMTVLCAWCNGFLYYKPCEPQFDQHESHGICDKCYKEKIEAELNK